MNQYLNAVWERLKALWAKEPALITAALVSVIVYVAARAGVVVDPQSVTDALAYVLPILLGGGLVRSQVAPIKLLTPTPPSKVGVVVGTGPVEGLPPDGDDRVHKGEAIVKTKQPIGASSPLKLGPIRRRWARRQAKHAALLGYRKAALIHYTQGPRRWDGIRLRLRAIKNQFPRYADCSAFVTWCLWTATRRFKLWDFVNGESWGGGYTGTMADHGERVTRVHKNGGLSVLTADAVLYGPGPDYSHTAIVVDSTWKVRAGWEHLGPQPLVVSHGSEGGPFLLPMDYRSDRGEVRRYIR